MEYDYSCSNEKVAFFLEKRKFAVVSKVCFYCRVSSAITTLAISKRYPSECRFSSGFTKLFITSAHIYHISRR